VRPNSRAQNGTYRFAVRRRRIAHISRLANFVPKYRRHKASGQAIVTLNGHDHYLGPLKTKASLVEYDRLILEWLARGREGEPDATGLTVVELVARSWRHAKGYYRKHSRPTGELGNLRDC
jgi:hypothetical protein